MTTFTKLQNQKFLKSDRNLLYMSLKKNSVTPSATVQDFPIIGVGASAGGLEAFKQFLSEVTTNSGMAYVLVQHLLPSHPSILPEILSRFTTIPVIEITDDIHLAPNHVYVIPENRILTSTDGVLKLAPRNKEKNSTIDIFFTSLAQVHLNLAAGVVLSGMGTDGTEGLKAIKEHGGITFAQDHYTAAYGEMPKNAIDAQAADFVLPADEIPAKLMEMFFKNEHSFTEDKAVDEENVYGEIITLLRKSSGVDFTYYKQTTIRRRIMRRMAICKATSLTDYLQILRENSAEPTDLFNDLLIPVTTFFRDPKVFNEVKENVFPLLINKKTDSNSIRIWVAGCSTGQEAYSLAIALHEFLGENLNGTQIKIFASDVSELSIAKARTGFYKTEQLSNVPEAYLKKYFTKDTTGYQINGHIRDMCVFAVHNFLKDPPFAKVDMITCRNVLIYMDVFLQKKALTTFHYALLNDGFLLLGNSETTTQTAELFTPYTKTGKIFTKKQVSGRFVHQAMRNKENAATVINIKQAGKDALKTDFVKNAQAVLMENYTPASVVINEHLDIVHINGIIVPFLELSQGKPTFNLLKIARDGLTFELRNALHKCKETRSVIVKEGIPIKFNGSVIEVTLEVRPLENMEELYYLVVFYNTPVKAEDKVITQEINESVNLKRISLLEKELLQTHADVNAIAEEQEASNEELQSANEELLSGSEELQSLNEELETSKEELQSSNEELITINEELINKQELINISRNYTEAIVATLREPIVVLDTNLRIKNINRAFSKKYSIAKEAAAGKLIYEIQNHLFDNPLMRSMLEKVLPQKTQLDDYEISVNLLPYGESVMLLNARQVTNEESKEQLILLAIEDITERKIIERRLQTLSDGFEAKVKERTAELETSNIELETSVRDLHQANIKLQQFAYIASHDLQEPLRKILTFINILELKHKHLPADTFAILNKISTSSARMKMLIHDLLAYSYLSNDTPLFESVDLNVVLKNILIDFELLIEQKEVKINYSALPVINAIPLQMNQLFYNLVSNALKFSNEDIPLQLNITVSNLTATQIKNYEVLNKNLSWCEIIFKDNGIGFDEQYEKQIFTIFQRLHNKDTYKGTGIGLAISHKIMENHGGIIFARSKVNTGAAFHILLPINRQ